MAIYEKDDNSCPLCGKELRKYDRVRRIVRTRYGKREWIYVNRKKCSGGHVVRVLPDYLMPYKHYSRDVIEGVICNLITTDTLGFEDYPCSQTMARWKLLYFHTLLWKEKR